MKKKNKYIKMAYVVYVCVFLVGCTNYQNTQEKISIDGRKEESEVKSSSDFIESDIGDFTESMGKEAEIADADWSEYFNGLNGTAVVYDASNRRYTMYNGDLALTRRSPCSTFKIILC